MWANWGSEQQEEQRYEVTYHTCLASGVDSYTPSRECVVRWTIHETLPFHSEVFFAICHAHMRKHTRLSPLVFTASDKKLGGGLGGGGGGGWERGYVYAVAVVIVCVCVLGEGGGLEVS